MCPPIRWSSDLKPGRRTASPSAQFIAVGEFRKTRGMPSKIRGNPTGTGSQKVTVPAAISSKPRPTRNHRSNAIRRAYPTVMTAM